MEQGILFKKESFQVMGACFEVYKEMGSGFLESVYQECLALEFASRGIPFEEHPCLRLAYKKTLLKQTYIPDFLCCGEVVVELKALKQIADEHRAQAINYLRATGKRLALLINFGHYPLLEHERIVL
ncbi:MAG: GxxExxY protein [Opitutae bacterium]|jgi:GxxExxY protein|nr:GxxExxY protein [Kiritimatiellia bacterium]NCC93987.1 GxxExxY protein [Opitutae bacterium]